MSAKKTPLQIQKEQFGGKEKLVDRVISVVSQITTGDSDKDAWKTRLLAASNKKLLRLFEVSSEIQSKFGSVDKLAAKTAEALGQAKDQPFVKKLATYTPAKLLDLYRSAEKGKSASAK